MPLTSTSLHWSEGNSGCRSLSKTSSHLNHFTSPDRSSSSSSRFAMARPRDATRDQRTASMKARFEWLKPWRTPQDCREGGLTLLYSMQDILARQASMHEPHAVRSTGISAASTTSSCPHQHFWPPPARGGGSVGREGLCSAADSGASSLDQRSRRGRGERNGLFAGSAPCLRNDRLQEVQSPVDVERTPPSPVVETAATAALAATRTAMAPLLTPPLPLSSAASVPPMVPAIPHFEEVKAEQEMISQRQQHPHPRSEAARRKRRALANSDDDDAGSSGPHHPDASCAGGKCDQTARPGDSRHHPCLRDEWDCSDGSEDELQSPLRRRNAASGFTDEVSEKDRKTSCGDGGHLACVPGDTLHQRYTLLKVLGVGRSSRVWLAADLDQCSLARRQLIRELGEGEVRRLFRTSERPMFVAIKVFRCDTVCAESALYELQLSTFVKESVQQQQQRCAPPSASYSASLPPSLTAVAPAGDEHGGHLQESSDREKCGTSWPRDGAAGRTRVNLVSPAVPRLPTSSTPRSCPSTEVAGVAPSANVAFDRSAAACTTARDLSSRLTTLHHAFAVEGAFGIHHCLVMDVLGAGVDRAINEAHLDGLPSAVARSIMQSSLQGLAVLAACHIIHTNLKPESLLFADLEGDVTEEMRTFNSAQLHPSQRNCLWRSNCTHRCEAMMDFSRRREWESLLHQSTAPSTMAEKTEVNTHSVHAANPTNAGSSSESSASSVTVLSTAAAAGHDTLRSNAREVRVSDFGLSLVVPPCLRLGVRALADYAAHTGNGGGMTDDELVRQDPLQQLHWLHTQQQARLSGHPGYDSGGFRRVAEPRKVVPSRLGWGECVSTATTVSPPMLDIGIMKDLIDKAEPHALELQEPQSSNADGGGCAAGLAANECDEDKVTDVASVPDVGAGRAARHAAAAGAAAATPVHHQTTTITTDSGVGDELLLLLPPPPPAILRTALASRAAGSGSGQSTSLAAVRSGLSTWRLDGSWATPQHSITESTRLERVAVAARNSDNGATPPAAATVLRRLECEIIRQQNYHRGAVIQSREYRAPEVLLGNFCLPSCDVWSMGCIAYELVSGHFLFDCIADRECFATASLRQQQQQQQQQQRQGTERDHTSDSNVGDKGTPQRQDKRDGQPIYLEDAEQDLDVFHLKAIMRLLGPPPVSLLRQQPMGLFVDNFFDSRGDFRFWERGEAEEAGIHLADPYRQLELEYGAGGAAGSGAGRQRSPQLLPPRTLPQRMNDVTTAPLTNSPPPSSFAGLTGLHDCLAYHGPGAGADALSPSATPSTLGMATPSASSGSAAAAATARRGASAQAQRDPQDTSNYPIKTPGWEDVRVILRDKLGSAEEAADFEVFLSRCLQWDPARRATAAELLSDKWIIKYSDIAADAIAIACDLEKAKEEG